MTGQGLNVEDKQRRYLSVANSIPIGVPLDRDEVEAQLKARASRRQSRCAYLKEQGAGYFEAEARAAKELEEEYPLEDGLGVAPVLWEVRPKATQHLLAAGDVGNLYALRNMLVGHADAQGEYWKAVVLETEEEQERALSLDISKKLGRMLDERLLIVVDSPESQEVISLLTEFAAAAREASGNLMKAQVHLAVLAETPAALPNALMRMLGYRVCFRTNASNSRDVVGDESAATLPWAKDFREAAVVYEREAAWGMPRRRDVYVGGVIEGETQ